MEDDATSNSSWLERPLHQHWLLEQTLTNLRFYRASISTDGWFGTLDDDGRPVQTESTLAQGQQVLDVARAVHIYAAAETLGLPGSQVIVELGLQALWERHRDREHGGYFNAVGHDGPTDSGKAAYNHAHVLLAAASALAAGHSQAQALLGDVLATIDAHFWDEDAGAMREDFDRSWQPVDDYRGANSNMHSCEALLAAAAATGRRDLAVRADRIAGKLINGFARDHDWLLPEHYDSDWEPHLGYNREKPDDPFRPYGATVGHSLEWARLVLGTAAATQQTDSWHLAAAEALYARAVRDGWDRQHGGLAYTLDWGGTPADPDHYWWPISEGIQTSSYLRRLTGKAVYELWYRRFWEFAQAHLIDQVRGGWYAELDPENRRKVGPWYGKPDCYHTTQASLMPLLPPASSLLGAVALATTPSHSHDDAAPFALL
jgi:mannose/cellobiose epimerase-like protein (N-acyl-D-glucosamine 2-epimerase family)